MTITPHPSVAKSRVAKAVVLETHARKLGRTAAELAVYNAAEAAAFARDAGTRLPSAETWRLMLLLLDNQQLPEAYR